MKVKVQRRVPAGHPSLAGHFPGNPIVPGVVILDEVMQALAEQGVRGRLAAIPAVKFLATLLPEEIFTVEFDVRDEGRVRFQCLAHGRVFAKGRLELVPE